MTASFSQEHKNRIACKITLKIAEAIKTRAVPEKELPEICNFVLVALDTITDHREMTVFLETLAKRWTIFASVVAEEKPMLASAANQTTNL